MSNSKCPGQDVEKYSSCDFIFRTPGPETNYFKHLFLRSKNNNIKNILNFIVFVKKIVHKIKNAF